jgi:hypothetical protein
MRADIHDGPEQHSSKQRPDTLMQDRICRIDENLLHRAAGPYNGSERGPLLEFNIGSHPGDSTHYVNAKDMLSLSLLQARLIDLGMPIKIAEGT